jgi:hypothetical protein
MVQINIALCVGRRSLFVTSTYIVWRLHMIASGCMSTECSAAAEQTLAKARRVPQHMFCG